MDEYAIVLIVAPSAQPDREAVNRSKRLSSPHLGLGYIAAILTENGYKVAIVDLLMDGATVDSVRRLVRHKAALVGITATTEAYNNALRLARICKETRPECITILGGPHVTFADAEALSDQCVDFVVRDEGEFAMLELAGHVIRGYGRLSDVKGLSYRDGNGHVVRNEARPFLAHLDDLPFPVRSTTASKTYQQYNGLLTARGCLGRCIFCSAGALSRGRYRRRSIYGVVDELLFLQRLGVRVVTFLDDNFTIDGERVYALCHLIKASGVQLEWAIESRVDTISNDLLSALAAAGCRNIQFGIESGVQTILDSIAKGITTQQISRVLSSAREAGMRIACSVMLGHPDDTRATIRETIDFCLELQKTIGVIMVFAVATPFPGTPMYIRSEELGLEIVASTFDDFTFFTPVCNTRHLRVDELRAFLFESYERSHAMKVDARNVAAS